jgi:hypothetical protein
MCNKYRPPLARRNPDDIKLAEEMLEKSKQGNHVQRMVEEEGLLKKTSVYTVIDCSSDQLKDFPVLTEEKLRQITLGIYQLKQALLYAKEHIEKTNSYEECLQN